MKKVKKVFQATAAAALAMVMSVSLFGCSGDNNEPVLDEDGNTIVQVMVHVAQQSA